MGVKKKTEPVKWTEERMQQKLVHFRSTPRYMLQNLYVFGWESDILFLSKSGFWTEIEIKVSQADFKADLKNKDEKHHVLSDKMNVMKPNQFFYAAPDGMLQPDEIPDYAGLLTLSDSFFSIHTAKPAPWLHRHKIDPKQLNLTDKFYYNMLNAKREALIAKRTSEHLTDAFQQGLEKGRNETIQAVLCLYGETCPHRVLAEEGRIHCNELNQTKFAICKRGLCQYLEDKEKEILQFLVKN